MAIFPAGKSTRIDSPRHLTLRHSRRLVAAHKRNASLAATSDSAVAARGDDGQDDVDDLPAGYEKLNSYWAPGLEAGAKHRIHVTQTIDANNGDKVLTLESEQDFFVDAPQFSLPGGSIHSTYPPAGYSDDHRILPHVVLTDPHLPWERLGSPSGGTNAELKTALRAMATGANDPSVRNRVPWLVVFSFSQDELRLPAEDLDGPASIFRDTGVGVAKPVKQSSTMTVKMTVEDLWKLTPDVTTPVTNDLGPEGMKTSSGDFIFVRPGMFKALFSTYDNEGKMVVGTKPATSQYQYLAHVRTINGSGMALAGVEDTAVFSIVVGNRAGPLDNETPTTMCVHLVSIEGVENMKFPSSDQRYVALCSLHSWNYTVVPPNTVNVPDAFEHLGSTLDVLRAPQGIIKPLTDSTEEIQRRIGRRLGDGYTMVKYRTQTGEATVALYRGPFTPTYVPPLKNLNKCSNSGFDLQILDKDLGIMDITYSVAWQTGRTLALGDEAFTAALGRIRSVIHKQGTEEVKIQSLTDRHAAAFRTRRDVLKNLSHMVNSLHAIHIKNDVDSSTDDDSTTSSGTSDDLFIHGGPKRRWHRPRLEAAHIPKLHFTSTVMGEKYPTAALGAARSLSKSTGGKLYDETNDPQSTDWMMVLGFIIDRMFLAGVPAHLLVADPTHLQPESLRFFRIDTNWVDALVDGALSLGNHFGNDLDRVSIKSIINDYINHTPDGHGNRVQIPAYGFYLRSDLVTMFPDLRVEVLADEDAVRRAGNQPPTGAPLLRHEIVTDGVMMGFMDRLPGSPDFSSLVFTQPAHQQRFAVARDLDVNHVQADIRRQYTVDQPTRETDNNRHDALAKLVYHPPGVSPPATGGGSSSEGDVPIEDKGSLDNIFIWDSEPGKGLNDLRILRLPKFAEVQLDILQNKMGTYGDDDDKKPYFKDDPATSALFAMQLNDPVYNLTIDLKEHPNAIGMASLAPPGGSGGPEVRTLKQIEASHVKKLVLDEPEGKAPLPISDDSSEKDGSEGAFERHENYTPSLVALSSNLAPHVRPLKAISGLAPAPGTPTVEARNRASRSGPGDNLRGPATAPVYDIRLGSNLVDKWDVITLDRANLPQDLIFSVLLTENGTSEYKLVELDIEIKLGDPAGGGNYLMLTYDGPGAHMLTNLRFNVLPATVDDGEAALRLRLLPRAAKGWIDASRVPELSFLLGLARVNTPQGTVGQVEIASWAVYCKNPDDPKLGPDNTYKIPNESTLVTVVNSVGPT